MGKEFDAIDDSLRKWIESQRMFFVGTAPLAAGGHVNVSPKGYDCFRILSSRQVAYLDLTGSGIETVAHVRENGRIVFMFCAFDQTARIVRLHGTAMAHSRGSAGFGALLPNFPSQPGVRTIVTATLTRIADSCGYGVPRYEYQGDRATLVKFLEKKEEGELAAYQRTRNARSLDGLAGLEGLEDPPIEHE